MDRPDCFGGFVRSRRISMGLTLRAFCERHGLNPGNWSRMERGLLAPPQAEEKLAEYASHLGIRRGTDEYRSFLDLAAAAAARIPKDLMSDEDVVRHLPIIFRTARGMGTPEDLEKLIALFRKRA